MPDLPHQCAQKLLETIPLVMRVIRSEVRRRRFPDFSLPQFRALAFVGRHPGASLSALAEHLGLALPAASRLVEGLVKRRCMARRPDEADRRRILLELTGDGADRFREAHEGARDLLASRLARLSGAEMATLSAALDTLPLLFGPDSDSSMIRRISHDML